MTKTMNNYRKTSLLCDFIIKIDGIDFPVHKVVVAAASPFFAALFESKENSFIENSENCIELQEITAENGEKVISYLYSGDIELDANNVQEIAKASSMYQLSNLFELCLEFMFGNIDPVNAIGLLCFAEYYASNSYKIRIKRYIEQNFSEICGGDEFKMLPESILKSFLRSEDLSIFSEDEVLLATLNWFAHDERKRMKFFREFIGYLRMPLVSAAEIDEIRSKFRNTNILKHFEELLQPRHCEEVTNTPYFQIRFHPRFCARKRIFVIGGNTPNNGPEIVGSNQVKTIVMSMDTWKVIQGPLLIDRVAESSCNILGDYLYVVGGIFQGTTRQTVQRLNIRQKNAIWQRFAPMNNCRHSSSLVVHKQKLYAIGGKDGMHPILNIEVYDPDQHRWIFHSILPQQIVGSATVKIGSSCYFIPNCHAVEWSFFYKYDMDTGIFEELPFWSSENIRSQFVTVVLQDSIYVIGGIDVYNKPSKLMNVYNIREVSVSHYLYKHPTNN